MQEYDKSAIERLDINKSITAALEKQNLGNLNSKNKDLHKKQQKLSQHEEKYENTVTYGLQQDVENANRAAMQQSRVANSFVATASKHDDEIRRLMLLQLDLNEKKKKGEKIDKESLQDLVMQSLIIAKGSVDSVLSGKLKEILQASSAHDISQGALESLLKEVTALREQRTELFTSQVSVENKSSQIYADPDKLAKAEYSEEKREQAKNFSQIFSQVLESPDLKGQNLLSTIHVLEQQSKIDAQMWSYIELEFNQQNKSNSFKDVIDSKCENEIQKEAFKELFSGNETGFVAHALVDLAINPEKNADDLAKIYLRNFDAQQIDELYKFIVAYEYEKITTLEKISDKYIGNIDLDEVLNIIGDKELLEYVQARQDGDSAKESAIIIHELIEDPDLDSKSIIISLSQMLHENSIEEIATKYADHYDKDLLGELKTHSRPEDVPLIEAIFAADQEAVKIEVYQRALGLRHNLIDPMELNSVLQSLTIEERAEFLLQAQKFAEENYEKLSSSAKDKEKLEEIRKTNGELAALIFIACLENSNHFSRMYELLEAGPVDAEKMLRYKAALNLTQVEQAQILRAEDYLEETNKKLKTYTAAQESNLADSKAELEKFAGHFLNPLAYLTGSRHYLLTSMETQEKLVAAFKEQELGNIKSGERVALLEKELDQVNEQALQAIWDGDYQTSDELLERSTGLLGNLDEILTNRDAAAIPELKSWYKEQREILRPALADCEKACQDLEKYVGYAKIGLAVGGGIVAVTFATPVLLFGSPFLAAVIAAGSVGLGMAAGESVLLAVDLMNGRNRQDSLEDFADRNIENLKWASLGASIGGIFKTFQYARLTGNVFNAGGKIIGGEGDEFIIGGSKLSKLAAKANGTLCANIIETTHKFMFGALTAATLSERLNDKLPDIIEDYNLKQKKEADINLAQDNKTAQPREITNPVIPKEDDEIQVNSNVPKAVTPENLDLKKEIEEDEIDKIRRQQLAARVDADNLLKDAVGVLTTLEPTIASEARADKKPESLVTSFDTNKSENSLKNEYPVFNNVPDRPSNDYMAGSNDNSPKPPTDPAAGGNEQSTSDPSEDEPEIPPAPYDNTPDFPVVDNTGKTFAVDDNNFFVAEKPVGSISSTSVAVKETDTTILDYPKTNQDYNSLSNTSSLLDQAEKFAAKDTQAENLREKDSIIEVEQNRAAQAQHYNNSNVWSQIDTETFRLNTQERQGTCDIERTKESNREDLYAQAAHVKKETERNSVINLYHDSVVSAFSSPFEVSHNVPNNDSTQQNKFYESTTLAHVANESNHKGYIKAEDTEIYVTANTQSSGVTSQPYIDNLSSATREKEQVFAFESGSTKDKIASDSLVHGKTELEPKYTSLKSDIESDNSLYPGVDQNQFVRKVKPEKEQLGQLASSKTLVSSNQDFNKAKKLTTAVDQVTAEQIHLKEKRRAEFLNKINAHNANLEGSSNRITKSKMEILENTPKNSQSSSAQTLKDKFVAEKDKNDKELSRNRNNVKDLNTPRSFKQTKASQENDDLLDLSESDTDSSPLKKKIKNKKKIKLKSGNEELPIDVLLEALRLKKRKKSISGNIETEQDALLEELSEEDLKEALLLEENNIEPDYSEIEIELQEKTTRAEVLRTLIKTNGIELKTEANDTMEDNVYTLADEYKKLSNKLEEEKLEIAKSKNKIDSLQTKGDLYRKLKSNKEVS